MATQSGSFTAADQTSGWTAFSGPFMVARGTGTGTVVLETRPVTAAGNATAMLTGDEMAAAGAKMGTGLPGGVAEYRLRCSAFTSGPITYSIING